MGVLLVFRGHTYHELCLRVSCGGLKVLNVLHVQLAGTRLVVRVYVRHERVSRAIDPFADYAPVLLLAFRVLIGNVALQRRL